MPSPSRNLSGIIIGLAPRADRYTRWELISADHGLIPVTAAQKTAQPFGLFDRIELVATSRGKNLFLKEAQLISRPSALAENLPAFTEAARLANLVRTAFREIPDYKPIYDIFEKSLEHYQTPANPALVTLKAFYKMLQAEGFPASQDWLTNLPSAQKSTAQSLLSQELSTISVIDPQPVLTSLISWAGRELGVKVQGS